MVKCMELPELEKANGAPAWMATFADLMSLLLCFFVLLFSFSQIDALKFKQIAGSMKMGFGVQRDVVAEEIPLGTSAVLDKFSPGKIEPTPFEEVKQHTVDNNEPALKYVAGEEDASGGRLEQEEKLNAKRQQVKLHIEQNLQEYFQKGALDMEDLGQQLVIRIKENGAFPAGSAYLQQQFKPILKAVGEVLADIPGAISISGHTDDRVVNSELFWNNWDLSAKRAVAVASELEKVTGIDASRIEVRAFADKKPLAPNDSDANRSLNRRVEIAINHGEATMLEPINLTN